MALKSKAALDLDVLRVIPVLEKPPAGGASIMREVTNRFGQLGPARKPFS